MDTILYLIGLNVTTTTTVVRCSSENINITLKFLNTQFLEEDM